MMHICFGTDSGYWYPTVLAAASALHWASDRARICIDIICFGIDVEKWNAAERMLRTQFGAEFGFERLTVDDRLFAGFRAWKGNRVTYARMLMPQLLTTEDWCLFCDGDALFTDDPLGLLPFRDELKLIVGSVDCGQGGVHERWCLENELGWDPAQYVCCGLFWFNLKAARGIGLAEKCLKFIADYPDAPSVDQEALNYLCRGRIGFLPPEWGCFSREGYGHIAMAYARPCFVHFVGDLPLKLKPMKYVGITDAQRLWFNYAERLTGKSVCDLVGIGRCKWFFSVFRAAIMKAIFRILRVVVPRNCRSSRAVAFYNDIFASTETWRRIVIK